MKKFLKGLLVLVATLSLAACVVPQEWVTLKEEQEAKVLAGETSARAFWEKAHEIAIKHNVVASHQVAIIEMIDIGKAADEKVIPLDEYRRVHRLTMAQFAGDVQAARQQAAAAIGDSFSEQSQRSHERSMMMQRRSINCTTTRSRGDSTAYTNCR